MVNGFGFKKNKQEMKEIIDIDRVVSMVKDGMTVMVGGFINAGIPKRIAAALAETSVMDLTIICNDAAAPDYGVGLLIAKGKVKKLITSYIGMNPVAKQLYAANQLEVEFVPQGTLVERIRAAGAGLGGILTPTGLGTEIAEGKEHFNIDGKTFLLEKPLGADIAIISASIGDRAGNLVYRGTAQNFNPMMATAAATVVAEVRELVEIGDLEPQRVDTPGIFVDYIYN